LRLGGKVPAAVQDLFVNGGSSNVNCLIHHAIVGVGDAYGVVAIGQKLIDFP